jgi:hypothetical protein
LQAVAGDYQLDLISRDSRRTKRGRPKCIYIFLEQFETTKQLNEEGARPGTRILSALHNQCHVAPALVFAPLPMHAFLRKLLDPCASSRQIKQSDCACSANEAHTVQLLAGFVREYSETAC